MQLSAPAPKTIISISFIVVLFTVILVSMTATQTPWFGISYNHEYQGEGIEIMAVDPDGSATGLLKPGDIVIAVAANNNSVNLGSLDHMEEPDDLPLYSLYNEFFKRQSEIFKLISADTTQFQLKDGRTVSVRAVDKRPLHKLPMLFWYQVGCGVIIFIAGIAVWAFRIREEVAFYYALTGLGLLIASNAAAIYSTRELALDGSLFHILSLINQYGTFLFAGPFISILAIYPKRLIKFPIAPVTVIIFQLLWLVNALQLYDSLDAGVRYPLITGLFINLSYALWQWRKSKGEPVTRAILKWFLFAWLSGSTIFVGMIMIPLVLGMEALVPQSIAWGILFTVYIGVAFGITRYRLFELDRWIVTG